MPKLHHTDGRVTRPIELADRWVYVETGGPALGDKVQLQIGIEGVPLSTNEVSALVAQLDDAVQAPTIYYLLDLYTMKVVESFDGVVGRVPAAASERAAARARVTKHTHMITSSHEAHQADPT